MCTEMTKRLRDVAGHLNKVGTKLNETGDAFDATVGSMERRVLVQARKIDELQGVDADKPIPELTEVARTSPNSRNPRGSGHQRQFDSGLTRSSTGGAWGRSLTLCSLPVGTGSQAGTWQRRVP